MQIISFLLLLLILTFSKTRGLVHGPGPGPQMQSRAVDTRVTLEIQEGLPRGTRVGAIPTKPGFTYRFNEAPKEFVLNANTGEIKTNAILDREGLKNDRFDLVVLSSQPTYPIEVRIVVLDVNDNAPEFPEGVINVDLAESAAAGTRILLDSAYDKDTGANGISDNYKIIGGNNEGKFRLALTANPTGETSYLHLETTGKLDRESQGFYLLNISAQDNGSPPKLGYLQVNITILDVNDNPPIFDHSDYIVSLNETVPPGTPVLRVMATDNDLGDNARISYYLSDSERQFVVDADTGVISTGEVLVCPPQQRQQETTAGAKSCVFTVFARDHGSPRQDGRTYVTVNLLDANDHDPVIKFRYFPATANHATVDENASNGSVVAAISVHDQDEGPNGETSVRILTGNDLNHFRLDVTPSFDIVRVNAALDREEISKYNLTIIASDNGNPARSSSAFLIIEVNDVNDHEPIFEKTEYSAVLSELSPIGSYVASIEATDEDSGVNSEIHYAFIAGNQNGWFDINSKTGLVTTISNLDREIQGTLDLNISARDGGPNPKWAFAQLKITILDENDEQPKFTQAVINASLSESAPPGSLIAMLTATDDDQGTNGSVTYNLHPSTLLKHPNLFNLDQLTGKLSTVSGLDREKTSFYEILIVAKDQGIPARSSTATVFLNVLDVNDNPPLFYPKKYFAAIPSGAKKGMEIVRVVASDLDEALNGLITYDLVSGAEGIFRINSSTGVISLSSDYGAYARNKRDVTDYQFVKEVEYQATERSFLENHKYELNPDIGSDFEGNIENFNFAGYARNFNSKGNSKKFNSELHKRNFNSKENARSSNSELNTRNFYSQLNSRNFKDFNINGDSEDHVRSKRSERENLLELEKSLRTAYDRRIEQRITEAAFKDFLKHSPDLYAPSSSGTSHNHNYLDLFSTDSSSVTNQPPSSGSSSAINSLHELSSASTWTINSHQSTASSVAINHPYSSASSGAINHPHGASSSANNPHTLSRASIRTANPDIASLPHIRTPREASRKIHRLTITAVDAGNKKSPENAIVEIVLEDNVEPLHFEKTSYEFSIAEDDGDNAEPGREVGKVGIRTRSRRSTDGETKRRSTGESDGTFETLLRKRRLTNGNEAGFVDEAQAKKISSGNEAGFVDEAKTKSTENEAGFVDEAKTNRLSSGNEARFVDEANTERSFYEAKHNANQAGFQNFADTITEKNELNKIRNARIEILDATETKSGFLSEETESSLIGATENESKVVEVSKNNIVEATVKESRAAGASKSNVLKATDANLSVLEATQAKSSNFGEDKAKARALAEESSVNEATKPKSRVVKMAKAKLSVVKAAEAESSVAEAAGAKSRVLEANEAEKTSVVEAIGAKSSVGEAAEAESSVAESVGAKSRVLEANEARKKSDDEAIGAESSVGEAIETKLSVGEAIESVLEAAEGELNTLKGAPGEAIVYKRAEAKSNVFKRAESESSDSKRAKAQSRVFKVTESNVEAAGFNTAEAESSDQATKRRLKRENRFVSEAVSYFIINGDPRGVFDIDERSGRIFTANKVDREEQSFYTLTIIARSGFGYAETTARVSILDLNDNRPEFYNEKTEVSLAENAAVGEAVYICKVRDLDSEINSRISFELSYNPEEQFGIKEATGVVFLNKPIVANPGSVLHLEITARDFGEKRLASKLAILINVRDVNDHTPVFDHTSYETSLPEATPVNTRFFSLSASDTDLAENSRIEYRITEGDREGNFGIFPDGFLYVKTALDREEKDYYSLVIEAADLGNPKRSSSVPVVIHVIDVNDNPPRFTNTSFTFSVSENEPPDTFVGKLTASDEDIGRNAELIFSLSSPQSDFKIDPKNGFVKTLRAFDREELREAVLTFEAIVSDNGSPKLKDKVKVNVRVKDVNDNPPKFLRTPYKAVVSEATASNTQILRLHTSDADEGLNGDVFYKIQSGNEDGNFEIDEATGAVVLVKRLDRERKDKYELLVTAYDAAVKQRLSASASVLIELLDENDNPPKFVKTVENFNRFNNGYAKQQKYHRNEKLWKRNQFETASLKNPNAFDFLALLAKVKSSDDFFKLLRLSGNSSASVNQQELLDAVKRLRADGFFSRSDTADDVLRLISDVISEGFNDLRARISGEESTDYASSGYERNSGAYEKSKGFYELNDGRRLSAYEQNTYERNDFNNSFSKAGYEQHQATYAQHLINYEQNQAGYGQNKVTYEQNPFNFDQNQAAAVYDLIETIRSFPGSNAHDFLLELKRRNLYETADFDQLSAFLSKPTNFEAIKTKISVLETTPINTELIKFEATDADLGLNSEITYTITSGNRRDTFKIDPISGVLSLHKNLDYEELTAYRLNITASDSGNPRLSTTLTFSVDVLDANDNPPSFTNTAIVRQIREGIPVHTPIVTVTAEDPDSGMNGRVAYEIAYQEPDDSHRHFGINPTTGVIHTLLPIDREKIDTFRLTVTATDEALPRSNRLSADKLVTVIVEDVNDNAPVFVSMNAAVLPTTKNALIMNVYARDLDSSTNGLVTYELSSGSSDLFHLHRSTGALTLKRSVSNQILPRYKLNVKATDEAVQSERKSTDAYITIISAGGEGDENGPVFSSEFYSGSVFENEAAGTSVLSVEARFGSAVEYYVTNVTGDRIQVDRLFDVDAKLGVLSTVVELDREAGLGVYEVEVYAIAVGEALKTPRTSKTKVRITVLDKNDSPPSFPESPLVYSASEDLGVGSVVATIRADDPDTIGTLGYTLLSSENQTQFTLDSETGVLRLADSLDRETKDIYKLTVRASDGIQHTDTVVTIQVTDTNDNPPVFLESAYSFDVEENAPRGSKIGQVRAEDPDLGLNAQLTYTVISDWANDVFSLNPQTGVFTLTSRLDYEEVQHYILVVQAQDSGSAPLSSTLTVYCNVIDLNDNAPIFDPMSYSNEIFENVSISTSVLSVSATDLDSGDNGRIEYAITSGDENGDFGITRNGTVYTKKALDRETRAVYNLIVTGTDLARPPETRLSSTVQATITLKDVNDMSPEFITSNTTSVPENSPLNTIVTAVKAVDKDEGRNGYIEYHLEDDDLNEEDKPVFSLGPVDGLLRVSGRIDRETKGVYVLGVVARDRGDPPRSARMRIVVSVEDVNDNSPVFDPRRYSASIAENASIGASVLQVSATDIDAGPNGRVRYTITDGDPNRDFTISSDTGSVRVAKNLNYERKSRYVLTVRAEDCADDTPDNPVRSDTAQITVAVTDINDNPPTFLDSPYLAYVMENVLPPQGGYVVTVKAYDADTPPFNSLVRYFIKEGDTDVFRINASTGEVSLLRALDREEQAEYTLSLVAMDTGSPPLTGTGTVRIIVQDANDNYPQFKRQSYMATIAENSPAGTKILTPEASDKDSGLNAKLRFGLSGPKSERFQIDPETGEIRTREKLDREETETYRLVLTAEDGAVVEKKKTSVNLTVIVEDENDNDPKFSATGYEISLPDSIKNGDFVFGARASDADEDANSKITYRLVETEDSNFFSIDEETGVIKAKAEIENWRNLQRRGVRRDKRSAAFEESDGSEETRFNREDTERRFNQMKISNKKLTTKSENTRSFNQEEFNEETTTERNHTRHGGLKQTKREEEANQVEEILEKNRGDYKNEEEWQREIRKTQNFEENYFSQKIDLDSHAKTNAQYFRGGENSDSFRNYKEAEREVMAIEGNSKSTGIFKEGEEKAIEENTKSLRDFKDAETKEKTIEENTESIGFFKEKAREEKMIEENTESIGFFKEAEEKTIGENTESIGFFKEAGIEEKTIEENAESSGFFKDRSIEEKLIEEKTESIRVFKEAEIKDKSIEENTESIGFFKEKATEEKIIEENTESIRVFKELETKGKTIEEKAESRGFFKEAAIEESEPNTISIINKKLNENSESFKKNADSAMTSADGKRKIGSFDSKPHEKRGSNLKIEERGKSMEKRDFAGERQERKIRVDLSRKAVVGRKEIDGKIDANYKKQEESLAGDNFEENQAQQIFVNKIENSNNRDFTGRTKRSVDFDRRIFNLQIEASDGGNPRRSAVASLKIHLRETQLFPIFDPNQKTRFTLKENLPSGALVTTVKARSPKKGNEGVIKYAIAGGNVGEALTVNGVTGEVRINGQGLDYEKAKHYGIWLEARDSDFVSLSSVLRLSITVTDANDNAPVFDSALYNASVLEEELPPVVVTKIHARDSDAGQNSLISYRLIEDYDGSFEIDEESGEIITAAKLDREEVRSYELQVEAVDHGEPQLTGTSTVLITVLDKNDNPPRFTRLFSVNVTENAEIDSFVIKVTSSDLDEGENANATYSFAENPGGKFKIDPITGNVTVSGLLDREQQDEYLLKVAAVDGAWRAETPLTVTIQDQNDNAPEFEHSLYSFAFPELQQEKTLVGRVIASDRDKQGPNSVISYSLRRPSDYFTVDPADGKIYTKKTLKYKYSQLEASPENVYTLAIIATDNGKPPMSSECTVNVNVIDANNSPPRFKQREWLAPVPLDSTARQRLVRVEATDESDFGINAEITYAITGGNGSQFFEIDKNSGWISIREQTADDGGDPIKNKPSRFIREINSDFLRNFNYYTSEEDGSDERSLEANPEHFRRDKNSLRISKKGADNNKSLQKDKNVGNINSGPFRRDTNDGNSFTREEIPVNVDDNRFSEDTNDENLFTRDGTTKKVDYNTFNEGTHDDNSFERDGTVEKVDYNRFIEDTNDANSFARDGTTENIDYNTFNEGTNDANSFTRDGTTKNIDYKRFRRDASHERSSAIDENLNRNRNTRQLNSSQFNDLGLSKRDVNEQEGELEASDFKTRIKRFKNNEQLRKQRPSSSSSPWAKLRKLGEVFTLRIKALDGGIPPRSDEAFVKLIITGENLNAPVFTALKYQVIVPENEPLGSTILTVSASDADEGPNGMIRYEISAGNELDKFEIDKNSGGIKIANSLDYDTVQEYNLDVTAYDLGFKSKKAVAMLTITLTDINDNPPVFNQSLYEGFLAENQPPGAYVCRFQAFDSDSPKNAVVRYKIASGNGKEVFSIDPISGVVRSKSSFDYEEKQEYTMEIVAYNPDSAMETSTRLQVHITGINEFYPKFTKTLFLFDVSESAEIGTKIGEIQATDQDLGEDGEIFYLFVGASNDKGFQINPLTGAISVSKRLDRETQSRVVLTVLAKNAGGIRGNDTAEAQVVVTIQDGNDPPEFAKENYEAEISEAAAVGTFVLRVKAVDKDVRPQNNQFSYAILGCEYERSYGARRRFIRELDLIGRYNQPEQTVSGFPSNNNYQHEIHSESIITANNINPESMLENNFAINMNSKSTVHIRLESAVGEFLDHSEAKMGENLKTLGALRNNLRGEIRSESILKEAATLSESNSRLNQEQSVARLNQEQLVLRSKRSDFKSTKNSEQFISDDCAHFFKIDPHTGDIDTAEKLDRETIDAYRLMIGAIDTGFPPQTGTTLVKIQVGDVNDNGPIFENNSSLTGEVYENSPPGTRIMVLEAKDPDLPPNGAPFTYRIIAGEFKDYVSLDKHSGVLTTTRKIFDREAIQEVRLVVEVEDSGSPKMKSSHTLRVKILDRNDSPSSPRSAHVLVYTFNQQFPIGKIAEVRPNDPDTTGNYSCRIIQANSQILSMDSGCDLHAKRINLNQGYSLSILGNDGVHADVTSSITVEFINFDNFTVEESVTVRVENLGARVFLAEYYGGFLELLKGFFSGSGSFSSKRKERAGFETSETGNVEYSRNKRSVDEIQREKDFSNVFSKFNQDGFNQKEINQVGYNQDESNQEGYDQKYKNREGVNQKELNQDGYDKKYNHQESFNQKESNHEGYNKKYKNQEGFNQKESNQEGNNKKYKHQEGFNHKESNQEGFNRKESNEESYNQNRLNQKRFNHLEKEGFNQNGFKRLESNQNGFKENRMDYNVIKFVERNGFNEWITNNENLVHDGIFIGLNKIRTKRSDEGSGPQRVMLYGLNEVSDGLELTLAVKIGSGYKPKSVLSEELKRKQAPIEAFFRDKEVKIDYNPCARKQRCENGGTCSEEISVERITSITDSANIIFTSPLITHEYRCACLDGFAGRHCDLKQNPCSPNPCKSGGFCRRQSHDFTCVCPSNRRGKFCELEKGNPCEDNPCANGGSCKESPDGSAFFCLCRLGYRGNRCESLVDSCRPNPCLRGGLCVPLKPGYKCSCTEGRYGRHCEKSTYSFRDLSYSTFPSLDPTTNDITFIFSTTKATSLLIYNYGVLTTGGRSDFVAVELLDGRAVLSFGGARSAITRISVSGGKEDSLADGGWYKITATRNGRVVSLSAASCTDQGDVCGECRPGDGGCYSDGVGQAGTLNFNNHPVLIGGLRSADPVLERPGQVHSDDFVGCVHSVTINGRQLNLSDPIESSGLETGCAHKSSCGATPTTSIKTGSEEKCGKGGTCLNRWHTTACACGGGVIAPDCFSALEPVSFAEGGFLEFRISRKHKRMQLLDGLYGGSSWVTKSRLNLSEGGEGAVARIAPPGGLETESGFSIEDQKKSISKRSNWGKVHNDDSPLSELEVISSRKGKSKVFKDGEIGSAIESKLVNNEKGRNSPSGLKLLNRKDNSQSELELINEKDSNSSSGLKLVNGEDDSQSELELINEKIGNFSSVLKLVNGKDDSQSELKLINNTTESKLINHTRGIESKLTINQNGVESNQSARDLHAQTKSIDHFELNQTEFVLNENPARSESRRIFKRSNPAETEDGIVKRMSIAFRTYDPNGLILYSASNKHFTKLELVDGEVVYTSKLTARVSTSSSTGGVADGLWHKVELKAQRRVLKVLLDGEKVGDELEMASVHDFLDPYLSYLSLGGVGGQQSVKFKGFEGCMVNFTVNSEVQAFAGNGSVFAEVKKWGKVGDGCVWKSGEELGIGAATNPLSIGITLVIVFFIVLLIAILVSFVVFRLRKQNKEKPVVEGKQGGNGDVVLHSSEQSVVGFHVESGDVIRGIGGLSKKFKERDLGDLQRGQRPDIIEREVLTKRDEPPIPPANDLNSELPEHYDLENASSIAPSDIDIIYHYKGYREAAGLRKYKPPVGGYQHKHGSGQVQAQHRHGFPPRGAPPVVASSQNRPHQTTPLARLSPSSEMSAQQPRILTLHDISGKPLQTALLATSSSAGVGKDILHSNSERSSNLSQLSGRSKTAAEAPELRTSSLVSTLDAVSQPAHLREAESSSTTDESGNDSFTCSEIEYDNASLPEDKYKPPTKEETASNNNNNTNSGSNKNNHPPPSYDGFDSSYRGSMSTLVASDDELVMGGVLYRPNGGGASSVTETNTGWDYLLSWGPNFESLAGVFKDIAELPDAVNGRVAASLRLTNVAKASEEYV